MRRLGLLLGLSLAAGSGLVTAGGCTTTPINSSLRALEQSGRVSFICLGSPLDDRIQQPLERCRNVTAASNKDFSGGTGGSDGSDGTAGTADVPLTSIVNVAGGSSTSMKEVFDLVGQLAGRELLIDQRPPQPGDVRRTGGDTTRARELLGWQPAVRLEDGLAAQLAWHRG